MYALIVCESGVMYSGNLLQEYEETLQYIGIKPSQKSDVSLFFLARGISKIYFQNGEIVTKIDEDLKKQSVPDIDINEGDVCLVRVKGGVSYRGQKLDNIPKELPRFDGLYITPNSMQETVICIPEHEIERVFTS